jgi:PAS domain-containing protein
MMPDYSLEDLICHRNNLENVLDNLKEGIIAHDMDRVIFFFNTEAERITGYRREEVLGRDCHEAFGSPFCGERCVFCEDSPKLPEKSEYTLNISTKSGILLTSLSVFWHHLGMLPIFSASKSASGS